MRITLIKLGGSLVTDKSQAYTALPQRIQQIGLEISRALEDLPQLNLVLGNGAGSFAHQSATKYATMNGFTEREGLYGACVVHQDAMHLNQIIVKEFLNQKIPAFSFQPSAVFNAESKQLSHSDLSVLESMVKTKYIPVLYGDVISDTKQGATIFSTDTIFRYVAENFAKRGHEIKIIHAGNYPGVLDENNQLIDKITLANYSSIEVNLHKASNTDVTGGMKLKVEEMLHLAKINIQSQIIDGTQVDSIYKALHGQKLGTLICNT